MNTYFPERPL